MIDHQRTRERHLLFVLRFAVAILAMLGNAAAIIRAVSVVNGGLAYEQIRQLAPAGNVAEVYSFDRWFVAYPVLVFAQIIPGTFLLALAPFQFSGRIRKHHLGFHRWSGRVLVVCAVSVGLSGLVLGAVFPYGGPGAASAVFVSGTVFLFAVVRGFTAIRSGDVRRHREWMIRMFAISLGIATVRVVGLGLLTISGGRFEDLAGLSFWTGWVLTFATAELWIRYTRAGESQVLATDLRG